MSLEDFCEDIVKKAQIGLTLSGAELCSRSGIDSQTLQKVKAGVFDEAAIRKIAPILELDADALVISGKKAWEPKKNEIKGLRRYISKYGDMGVNAYLVWDPETHQGVIFDTGIDASALIKDIKEQKIIPKMLLLTHSHEDHIADVDKIQKAFQGLKVVIHEKELIPQAEGITEGMEFEIGRLKISTRKTSGHSVGGLTYVVEGLEKPIAVVGDALFAGSMGGTSALAYKEALENIRSQILSLPEETIICPGHGPTTTVKEEKEHNPFLSA